MRILLAVIVVAGGVLRCWRLGAKGLWLDEAFSVWLARQPLPELWSWVVRIDQHPPLYYVLLHFWMRFGDSAAFIRLFSALIGMLTIPVVYRLGRCLLGPQAALIGALILAISPYHVRYGQEARMYTLLTLQASLAMLFLAQLLTDPRAAAQPIGGQLLKLYRTRREWAPQRRRPSAPIAADLAWMGYLLFSALALWTHNAALLLPVAANLFVLGFWLWRRVVPGTTPEVEPPAMLGPPALGNWLAAQVGLLLLWSPWLPAFVSQAAGVYREFWIPTPTWETLVLTLQNFLSAFFPLRPLWAMAVWGLFGLVLLWGLRRLHSEPARLLLLLALFMTPPAAAWLVSLIRPVFSDRTLIWVTVPLYLLLATGFVRLRTRPFLLAGLVLLVAVNGLSLRQYYVYFEKEAWREAAAYVADQVQEQDLILFNATWVQIPFDFYFRQVDRQVAEHGVPVDLFARGVLEPKMMEEDLPRLRTLVGDRERVWLVYSHDWYTDPRQLIPTALEAELALTEQRIFNGLELRRYDRRRANGLSSE